MNPYFLHLLIQFQLQELSFQFHWFDLIYENADGTYTICDYKSDTEIDSEKYRAQQECYRAAVSKMLKISEEKISLILYYLRHKECVNIST